MSASIKNISRYYQARYQSRFEYPDPDWEELATSSGIAQPRNPKIRYFSPNYPLPYYGRKNGTLRRKLQRWVSKYLVQKSGSATWLWHQKGIVRYQLSLPDEEQKNLTFTQLGCYYCLRHEIEITPAIQQELDQGVCQRCHTDTFLVATAVFPLNKKLLKIYQAYWFEKARHWEKPWKLI